MTRTIRPARHSRTFRLALAGLLAVGALGTTAAAHAADVDGSKASRGGDRPEGLMSVDGIGGGELGSEGFPGDPVTFEIRGHTTEPNSPLSVEGTFHVTHTRPDGSAFAEFEGALDCLWVGGDVAVATGVISESATPGLPGHDLVGLRVGFTVDDHGRRDRIGWSWASAGFEADVPYCTSTAPIFEIEHGNYRVRD